jgi:hypothetical protein
MRSCCKQYKYNGICILGVQLVAAKKLQLEMVGGVGYQRLSRRRRRTSEKRLQRVDRVNAVTITDLPTAPQDVSERHALP